MGIAHPGDHVKTLRFCADQVVELAREAIEKRGKFSMALSGGSTPKALYKLLASEGYAGQIDWSKVYLFWSDERSVPPDHPESNYGMAMAAGFDQLPIPQNQIFRMKAESQIEEHALEYEKLLLKTLEGGRLDLVMLGMGPDGHTASLFPHTEALHAPEGRLVVANFVPKFETWRMTFTYELIHRARHISIYVLGASKREMVGEVLHGPYEPDRLPIQGVSGALWIVDFPPP